MYDMTTWWRVTKCSTMRTEFHRWWHPLVSSMDSVLLAWHYIVILITQSERKKRNVTVIVMCCIKVASAFYTCTSKVRVCDRVKLSFQSLCSWCQECCFFIINKHISIQQFSLVIFVNVLTFSLFEINVKIKSYFTRPQAFRDNDSEPYG